MKHLHTLLRSCFSTAAVLAVMSLSSIQARAEDKPANGEQITATGEVVDLMCYLDHGAKGDKHAKCAKTCISSGGPVGLLTDDGALYLLIGQHEPANEKLAEHAAKKITVVGKLAERNGMKMIENIEIKG